MNRGDVHAATNGSTFYTHPWAMLRLPSAQTCSPAQSGASHHPPGQVPPLSYRFDKLDELLSRLTKQGAKLVKELVQNGDLYRLCAIRVAKGLLIGLAEHLGHKTTTDILENT